MDTRPFEEQVAGMFGVAWSVTLRLFHGIITIVVILVTLLLVWVGNMHDVRSEGHL